MNNEVDEEKIKPSCHNFYYSRIKNTNKALTYNVAKKRCHKSFIESDIQNEIHNDPFCEPNSNEFPQFSYSTPVHLPEFDYNVVHNLFLLSDYESEDDNKSDNDCIGDQLYINSGMSRSEFIDRWSEITSAYILTDKAQQQILKLFSDALPPSNSCPSMYELKNKSDFIHVSYCSDGSVNLPIKDQLCQIIINNYDSIIKYQNELNNSNPSIIKDFQHGEIYKKIIIHSL